MASRPPELRIHADEILADNFAGGGGASTGLEWATGRSPDFAINHDAKAIAMHQANHPRTRHFCEDVFKVNPRDVVGSRRIALAWFSPDCFPAGTMVLAQDGYRPIEEIEVGDEVLTHRLRWRTVTNAFRSIRPLVRLRAHGHPGLLVSPEHPFYARRRNDVWRTAPRGYERTLEPSAWTRAADLDRGSFSRSSHGDETMNEKGSGAPAAGWFKPDRGRKWHFVAVGAGQSGCERYLRSEARLGLRHAPARAMQCNICWFMDTGEVAP